MAGTEHLLLPLRQAQVRVGQQVAAEQEQLGLEGFPQQQDADVVQQAAVPCSLASKIRARRGGPAPGVERKYPGISNMP